MEFHQLLQQIRKEHKISQEELAEELGVSRQAVAKWENGMTFPDIKNLIHLSEFFCVTIDSLVKESAKCSTPPQLRTDISIVELTSFVKEANQHTYAGNGIETNTCTHPNSHQYVYEHEDLKYIDCFMGGGQFSGCVSVYKDQHPKWTMNYCGKTLEEQFSIDFLKEALFNMPEALPIRGAKLYKNGNYTYHNHCEGTFAWFHGKEEIFYGDAKVYEGLYHGGMIL